MYCTHKMSVLFGYIGHKRPCFSPGKRRNLWQNYDRILATCRKLPAACQSYAEFEAIIYVLPSPDFLLLCSGLFSVFIFTKYLKECEKLIKIFRFPFAADVTVDLAGAVAVALPLGKQRGTPLLWKYCSGQKNKQTRITSSSQSFVQYSCNILNTMSMWWFYLLLKVITYLLTWVKGPMQGVGSKGTLSTLAGQGRV